MVYILGSSYTHLLPIKLPSPSVIHWANWSPSLVMELLWKGNKLCLPDLAFITRETVGGLPTTSEPQIFLLKFEVIIIPSSVQCRAVWIALESIRQSPRQPLMFPHRSRPSLPCKWDLHVCSISGTKPTFLPLTWILPPSFLDLLTMGFSSISVFLVPRSFAHVFLFNE